MWGPTKSYVVGPTAKSTPLQLLYGGCAVRSNGRIVNRTDADLGNWGTAPETFAVLGAETVIPSHGARFDPAMIQESIEAVRKLQVAPAE